MVLRGNGGDTFNRGDEICRSDFDLQAFADSKNGGTADDTQEVLVLKGRNRYFVAHTNGGTNYAVVWSVFYFNGNEEEEQAYEDALQEMVAFAVSH